MLDFMHEVHQIVHQIGTSPLVVRPRYALQTLGTLVPRPLARAHAQSGRARAPPGRREGSMSAITQEQAQQFAHGTIFSSPEIQSLYQRFVELDISGNSRLEYEVSV